MSRTDLDVDLKVDYSKIRNGTEKAISYLHGTSPTGPSYSFGIVYSHVSLLLCHVLQADLPCLIWFRTNVSLLLGDLKCKQFLLLNALIGVCDFCVFFTDYITLICAANYYRCLFGF